MQVTDHIHLIRVPFQIHPAPEIVLDRFVNVYLVCGENGMFLIDAGVSGAEKTVYAYMRSIGRKPEDLVAIILTHSHPDHLGAALTIRAETGCLLAAHPSERDWIEDAGKQERERPVPGFSKLVRGSVPLDRPVNGGERIKLHDATLEVIHTPGHSRGSLSFHIPEDRALITGDAVPVPGDIPIYDDSAASIWSLDRLRALPDIDILLSAWDDPRRGEDVARFLGESRAWVGKVSGTVLKCEEELSPESPEFVRTVLERLGLPCHAANPLVARTFRG